MIYISIIAGYIIIGILVYAAAIRMSGVTSTVDGEYVVLAAFSGLLWPATICVGIPLIGFTMAMMYLTQYIFNMNEKGDS